METNPQTTENRQEKHASLLRDLLDCMERERQRLMEVDVPGLWTVMEEKHAILEAIQGLGPAHDDATRPPGPRPDGGGIGDSRASALGREMNRLKEEIRSSARENAEFVRSSLAVFDELISRLTNTAGEEEAYGPRGSAPRTRRRPIYRLEV